MDSESKTYTKTFDTVAPRVLILLMIEILHGIVVEGYVLGDARFMSSTVGP